MKDLKGIKGTHYLDRIIAEGEHLHQDFKFALSDARKIARSISAFANHDGGRLLIGVKDNGTVSGVRNEEDVYVVETAAQVYCKPAQPLRIDAFRYEADKIVVRVEIDRAPERPVYVSEADGTLHAYYRVADENITASPLMVKAWQHKRSCGDIPVTLVDRDRDILACLAPGASALPALAMAAGMSMAAAEEAVCRLFALDMVEFTHSAGAFLISLKESSFHDS